MDYFIVWARTAAFPAVGALHPEMERGEIVWLTDSQPRHLHPTSSDTILLVPKRMFLDKVMYTSIFGKSNTRTRILEAIAIIGFSSIFCRDGCLYKRFRTRGILSALLYHHFCQQRVRLGAVYTALCYGFHQLHVVRGTF